MGSVRRKVAKSERRDTLKRGKSFSLHYPNKYSTFDGRASRGNSRPSLSALTIKSSSNISDFGTPRTLKSASEDIRTSPSLAIRSGSDIHSLTSESSSGVNQPPNEIKKYEVGNSPVSATQSEYANVITLNQMETKQEQIRSHSFSMPKKDQYSNFVRTGSVASEMASSKKSTTSVNGEDTTDFATKLSIIQGKLNQKNDTKNKNSEVKNHLQAKYDHAAQDASQLSFQKGDVIIPACEATSGWQYGQNEKTKKSGWFPASYVEETSTDTVTNGDASAQNLKSKFARPSSTSSRKPPPVAKKSVHGPARRKITVTGVPTMTSSPSSPTSKEERRSSSAEPPSQITGSTSVPQMIHILSNGDNAGEPKRKQSSSMNDIETDIQQLNSPNTSVSNDQSDDPPSPPPIINGVDEGITMNDVMSSSPPPPESSMQDSFQFKVTPSPPSVSKHKKRSYDMPPPPPPPELLAGVDDDAFIIIQANGSNDANVPKEPKKKLSTFGI